MQNTFENLVSQIDNSVTLSQAYWQQYRHHFDDGRYTILLQFHEQLTLLSQIRHINDVCVYYRDWEYTVSAKLGLAGLEYYPDALFLMSLDTMGFRYRKAFFRMKPIRGGESLAVFTIIRSIPVYYFTEFPDAWAVIDIDLASLNDIMADIFNVDDSYFSIISADETTLVSIGNDSIKEIINSGILNIPIPKSDSGVRRIESSEHLILYAPSFEQELTFVYIEPYSTIQKNWYNRFLISAIAATTFVFLVGVLGSLFFSRRIFNPIKAIFEKTNITSDNNQRKKETDLILQKINELIEYNSSLERGIINHEKKEIPYPVSIENNILRAFSNGDIDELEKAVDSFRAYYAEKPAELEKAHGAYLRLFCTTGAFIPGWFNKADENPYYRTIFTFTAIDEIHAWIINRLSQAFYILHAHKRTQSRILKDICQYIDSNLGEDITAKGLSRRFNYHPSSLRRLFREELNLTLKSYVDSKRIEKAKELLLTTNLKIQDIAVQVGYTHTQSFIAFFHQIVHCTPVEFRRNNS
jgi:AraC-like DNA-binding protein